MTSAFSLNLFFQERTSHDIVDIRKFPSTIGEWKGKDLPIQEWEYRMLETRNLITREYRDPSGRSIFMFIVYSETNRGVFHPPEVCLEGSGTTILDKQPERIDLDGGRSFLTNKLYLERNSQKEMALYCYKAGDFYTDNFYLQQTYLSLTQAFGKRAKGATIRILMDTGGDEKASLASLKDFLVKTVKAVDSL
jgi:EpsI family protein